MPILIAPLLLAAQSLSDLAPPRVITLQTRLPHVQGIDVDGDRLWVTSVDAAARKGFLHEFELPSGRMIRSVELQDGPRFHPGGMSVTADAIWIPVAEYRAKSTAVIQKRNRATLKLDFEFAVPDHIGCLAVTPDSLIGGNWDTRDLYVWDHRGARKRTIANSSGNAFQDLKWVDGQLLGGGLLADRSGAIDWLEFPALRSTRRITAGRTGHGVLYTREGMTLRGGNLYLLPEDGDSRLFIFKLP